MPVRRCIGLSDADALWACEVVHVVQDQDDDVNLGLLPVVGAQAQALHEPLACPKGGERL